MPDEVIEIIAKNISTNVRDLEAALTKLIAYAELVHKDITLEIAQNQLKDVFSQSKHGNVTIDNILRVVADYFKLSYNDLKGKKRTKNIALPRQIAMYIARDITEYSTTELGFRIRRKRSHYGHARMPKNRRTSKVRSQSRIDYSGYRSGYQGL